MDAKADGYSDVLSLEECKCDESDDAVRSSAGEKQMGIVMCCVSINANAIKAMMCLEAALGEANAKRCMHASWSRGVDVGCCVGERGSSAGGRVQVLGMHACL